MKRIISMLIAVSMLLSAVTFSVFAQTEAEEQEVIEEVAEVTVDESKIGVEVEYGNDLYSIKDDGLYVSKDFGRDTLMASGEITWVIEREGALYWSKIEGYNADIYRLNLENGNETILTRVFVPTTAFDVEGDFVYYLYNGEISKINVLTGEEVSMGMYDCDGFYLDNNSNISLLKMVNSINVDSTKYEKVQLNSTGGLGGYKYAYASGFATEKSHIDMVLELVKKETSSYYYNKVYDMIYKAAYNPYPIGKKNDFPYSNSYSGYVGAVYDSGLGQKVKWDGWNVKGCACYSNFASKYITGVDCNHSVNAKRIEDVMDILSDEPSENEVKQFIEQYVNPGEHVRFYYSYTNTKGKVSQNYHSIIYLAKSSDNKGFYYLSYPQSNISGVSNRIDVMYSDYSRFSEILKKHWSSSHGKNYTVYVFDAYSNDNKNHPLGCSNCSNVGTKQFDYYGDGVCAKCHKTPYKYQGKETTSGITTGVWKRKSASQTQYGNLCLRSTPYSHAASVKKQGKFDSLRVNSVVANADGG